jgi:hypothetical protein
MKQCIYQAVGVAVRGYSLLLFLSRVHALLECMERAREGGSQQSGPSVSARNVEALCGLEGRARNIQHISLAS